MKTLMMVLALLTAPAYAMPGGGNEGVDLLPCAVFDVSGTPDAYRLGEAYANGMLIVVTEDGSMYPTTRADVDGLYAASEIVADVSEETVSYAVLGTAVEAAALTEKFAPLLSMISTTMTLTAPTAPDTHPKQPKAVAHMKKEWRDVDGKEHIRYLDVETERRGGEDEADWTRRHEANVEAFEKVGYTSIPGGR